MSSQGFTHEVRLIPSYDNRETDRGGGACGVKLYFILRGPGAALTFKVITDWMARPLTEPFDWDAPKPWPRASEPGCDKGHVRTLMDAGVSLHCPAKAKEWWLGPNECDVLGGLPCYGDTGMLVGAPVLAAMVAEGDEGLWREMREIYDAWMTFEPARVF